MLRSEQIEHIFEQIKYLKELFNGIAKTNSNYPSQSGMALYDSSTIQDDERALVPRFLHDNDIKDKYPDGFESAAIMGASCNYLFISIDEYFTYYQNNIDALMEFTSLPSEKTYNRYLKTTFGEDIPVEFAVINGIYYREIMSDLNTVDENDKDIKLNIDGKEVTAIDLINNISRILQEVYKNYRNESSNLGDIMIQDYMNQLGLEIPELATIDDE